MQWAREEIKVELNWTFHSLCVCLNFKFLSFQGRSDNYFWITETCTLCQIYTQKKKKEEDKSVDSEKSHRLFLACLASLLPISLFFNSRKKEKLFFSSFLCHWKHLCRLYYVVVVCEYKEYVWNIPGVFVCKQKYCIWSQFNKRETVSWRGIFSCFFFFSVSK